MFEGVIALAQVLDPITRVINFALAVFGIPLAIWKGRQAQAAILGWFGRIGGGVAAAATEASKTATAVEESAAANTQVNGSVMFMADTLGETRKDLDWMARRNDDTLAALFQALSLDNGKRRAEQDLFEERVRRLEQFQSEAAELRRGGRHATGPIDTEQDTE